VKAVEVTPVRGRALAGALRLLEGSLRGGEPVSEGFVRRLDEAIERGELEVLAVRAEGRIVGVAVLAYRLSVSLGGTFASIEDLYVRPEARGEGVGRALLEAIGERCAVRGISYVEAQVKEDEAELFYVALGYEPERGVRVLSKSLTIIDQHRRR
jgi:GNAT superfamily N-acetyltransferase